MFFCKHRGNGLECQSMNLNFKKLHPDTKVPTYAHPFDAGFDVYSIGEIDVPIGGRVAVPTGLALEIPDGYVGLVWDKSGMSFRHGLKTLGGVIDSGYRGEIQIGLVNLGDAKYVIHKGDKIAQILIQKVEQATFQEVEELSDTSRGEGGFGSSGKS